MMAEEKITKLGKRGVYSSEHKLKFQRTEDGKAWTINVQEREKSEIDTQRTDLNTIKNSNKADLIKELETPEYKAQRAKAEKQDKELTQLRTELKKSKQKKLTEEGKKERSKKERKAFKLQTKLNQTNKDIDAQKTEYNRIANYAIEQKYTERKGQKKPRTFNFKQQDKLKEAREAYHQRVKLDAKSTEERRGQDLSDRRFYDSIRNAKKQGRRGIYLYGENELKLSEIQQITDKGKVITADKTPLQRDGKVVAYRIPKDKIIAIGNTATLTVSNVRRPHLVITKEKITKRKKGNKIIFTREGQYFITRKKIDLLFKKAQEKYGFNAPIYLNNIPFEQSSFIKVKGGWALTPSALADLNAPEYEGTISVRYSQRYRKELVSLETRTKLGEASRAEKQDYGRITTTLPLGSTLENIEIICRSADAYAAIRKMVAINKKGNAEIYCVVSRDFTASKQNGKAVIELTDVEREGNHIILSKDTVTDEKGNLIGKYGVYDKYLVISWKDGYFIVQAKFLDVIYGGLKSDKGEEEEKFDSP